MNITQIFINLLTIGLSVSLAASILLHDTNTDKAVITAAHRRAGAITPVAKPVSHPHTHATRDSLHQAVRDLNASQPRTQPRTQDRNRYMQAKPSARGHHPFDNYTLPVID